MKKYPARQVLTVKELNAGDVLHCGSAGGMCIPWHVVSISPDRSTAKVKVGSTIVEMTGRDIRSGLPMIRPEECPLCALNIPVVKVGTSELRYSVLALGVGNVPSGLSGVDNLRKKNTLNTGGAAIVSKRQRRTDFTRKILGQLFPGS